MDLTYIPGVRELRNNQLIISCRAPQEGVQVGQIVNDLTPTCGPFFPTPDPFQWRVSWVERDGDAFRIYLDPVVPYTPLYNASPPAVLEAISGDPV